MTARRSISTRERVAIFTRHNGLCHMCSRPIAPGEAWDVSHQIPLELGGADDDANRKPAHKKCHREHTAKTDAPMIAKAKRREAAHTGSKAPPARKLQSRGFEHAEKPSKIARGGKIDKSQLIQIRWNPLTRERLP